MATEQLLAIDPGTTHSAFVDLWNGQPVEFGIEANDVLAKKIARYLGDSIACEIVACYGQPVGAEVFETCVWIGRFMQSFGTLKRFHRVYRKDVKLHLCNTIKGVNDAVIRQALVDRFGPCKAVAVGSKKSPGPLYGMKGDEWAALAVGVTWFDQNLVSK